MERDRWRTMWRGERHSRCMPAPFHSLPARIRYMQSAPWIPPLALMFGPADRSNSDHGAGRDQFCTLTAAYGSASRLWIGRFGLVGQVRHVRLVASADAAGIWQLECVRFSYGRRLAIPYRRTAAGARAFCLNAVWRRSLRRRFAPPGGCTQQPFRGSF